MVPLTMPLQQMPIHGHSSMATLRNALLPWNSWARYFFASTWWPNRASCREEFVSRWAVNIFSLLNLSAKKPYSAALLMELVLFLHCEGCSIAPNHIPREYNTWADELTHPDFEGFSLDRRLPAPETLFFFPFAKLLSATGFS